MSSSGFALAAAPLLPWAAIALLGRGGRAGPRLRRLAPRAAGCGWRAMAIAVLLAALVNPSLIEEQRAPQRDVAIVVVDESPSQSIGDRRAGDRGGAGGAQANACRTSPISMCG